MRDLLISVLSIIAVCCHISDRLLLIRVYLYRSENKLIKKKNSKCLTSLPSLPKQRMQGRIPFNLPLWKFLIDNSLHRVLGNERLGETGTIFDVL